MAFTDMLPEPWNVVIPILLIFHILALVIWGLLTARSISSSKTPKNVFWGPQPVKQD